MGAKASTRNRGETRPEPFGSRGHQLRPSPPCRLRGQTPRKCTVACQTLWVCSTRRSKTTACRESLHTHTHTHIHGQNMTVGELPQCLPQGPCRALSLSLQTHLSWNETLGQEESLGKTGFRVQGSGVRGQDSRFRVQGSGFRVQGSGFRVQGSGCRVQGMHLGCPHGARVLRRPAPSRTEVVALLLQQALNLIGKMFQFISFLAVKFTARLLYYY